MKQNRMRDGFLTIIFTALATAWGASAADAHHSFAAEFDITKPVTLTGKVTKIEWTNPHAFLFIDVQDKQTGTVTNWEIEMGSPNGLTRLGWTRTLLKTGDEVTVEGSLGRNKANLANARSVVMTTTTGKKLGAASSEGAR
jgi:DNA/RNA endonuclease YhcR with UshA esterase domain